ncbi:phage tail protein [Paracoccus sp. DMF]|uniref:phage tail protein n=1 Tax=Paracoccus sp. DMF TaxID=400837 RepID=UPI0021E4BB99|nr:phage tail protein [Paracoccus sp. DMF]MCV2446167.1 phage tail protein [Paracoccus sp. DMF]
MTGSPLARRLRPGLDPNGSFWAMLRYPQDWAAAAGQGAAWDPARGGLALAPLARPELAADWLPLAPVAGPDGFLYRSDPASGRVLRKGPCDDDFSLPPGFGGEGTASGRFRTPAGLAFDARGRLYVADPGNARVQVIDPASGAVIAILDAGLRLPTLAAIAADGSIYVSDAGTRMIHVFSRRFQPCGALALATLGPTTNTPWPAEPPPRPLAVTVLADGTLAVFDPLRPMLWHMRRDGAPLQALGWFDEAALPAGWSPTPRRNMAEAELILGPIDGGIYDLAWHRIEIDADTPPGTTIEVQTFAANEPEAPLRAWAPERPIPMPRALADARGKALDRLVLSDRALWSLWRLGRMVRDLPVIASLAGSGPVNAATLTLPRAAAARLRAGDRLRLTTPAGGEATAEIAAVAAATWTAAAWGDAALLAAPPSLALIEQDGLALPYGPLDLSFLGAAPALLPSRTDGKPGTLALPPELAAILGAGDVIEARDGKARARIELVEPLDEAVQVTLTAPVAGDFSTATVSLAATPGRLILREALPLDGPVPPGATVSVISDEGATTVAAAWADAATGTLFLSGPLEGNVTAANWTNALFPEPAATDRGRYLWLRLRMTGRGLPPPGRVGPPTVATATPVIRALRISAPRYSLLAWLPPLFAQRDAQAEPPGGNFLERFLSLFEDQFTEAEAGFESLSRLLNPRAADADWLAFVAGWLDLAFDPSWPIERRRRLVIEGASLQAGRGTPAALRRYLEIYTGNAVGIVEAFRNRPPEPIQLGARGALGVAPLGVVAAAPLAHRFSVSVTLPGRADRRTELSAVRKIIDEMKPAHTEYTLKTGGDRAACIGMGATVGAIVIPGPGRTRPCTCDPDAPPGDRPQPGKLAGGGFRLSGRLGGGRVTEYRPQGGADVQVA